MVHMFFFVCGAMVWLNWGKPVGLKLGGTFICGVHWLLPLEDFQWGLHDSTQSTLCAPRAFHTL